MIKTGAVQINKTASVVSGKPCHKVDKDGEPICHGEESKKDDFKKVASQLSDTRTDK